MSFGHLIINIVELLAALAGSYYWLKTKDQTIRPFVWYLWFVVLIETIALYPYLYGNIDNALINWLEHSLMRRNTWLYNIYDLVSLLLIWMFMKRNIKVSFSHKVINITVFLCIGIIILYFFFSGNFFVTTIDYPFAIATFAIFTMAIVYLWELVRSDQILSFYKDHVFYIIIAMVLFYICTTPLLLFSEYFNLRNKGFIQFRGLLLTISNIILYSCYIFAFFYSLHHKKKLELQK
ncbi:MAG: hypothetical protein HRU49_13995 [Winogradskyella sp.]|uniref:hypothetical protein n=1 Tax=Winogradskyella sp. TaxID=1883156 RepID=UPI0025E0C7EF|nr:hypothetical protein [Winogradskyella sp.]NRB84863.1 hypothetical protein [Winogradskyella sp.]